MRAHRVIGALTVVLVLVVSAFMLGGAFTKARFELAPRTDAVAQAPDVDEGPTMNPTDSSRGSEPISDRPVTARSSPDVSPITSNPESAPPQPTTPSQTTNVPLPVTTDGSVNPNTPPSSTASSIISPVPRPNFFTIMLGGNTGTGKLWTAPYIRVLPSGAEWLDGDRAGYRCAYMFLAHQGQIVGRVTFARIDGVDYAVVNDKHMDEGMRYYDGSLAGPGAPKELGECPFPAETYQPSTGPEERATIVYWVDGMPVETRNYKATEVRPGVTFQQMTKTSTRITVVGYLDGLPAIVVYYDVLATNAAITSDF